MGKVYLVSCETISLVCNKGVLGSTPPFQVQDVISYTKPAFLISQSFSRNFPFQKAGSLSSLEKEGPKKRRKCLICKKYHIRYLQQSLALNFFLHLLVSYTYPTQSLMGFFPFRERSFKLLLIINPFRSEVFSLRVNM